MEYGRLLGSRLLEAGTEALLEVDWVDVAIVSSHFVCFGGISQRIERLWLG